MKKPLILITLSYIVGLLLGHGFLYFPYTFMILLAVAVVSSLVLLRMGRLTGRSLVLMITVCILGIIAYSLSAAYFPSDHYTRHIKPDRAVHTITGEIVSPLGRDPGRIAFVLAVDTIDGTHVTGRMRVSLRDDQAIIGYGDILRMRGRLYEPGVFKNPGGFDYAAYLAQKNIYMTVSVKNAQQIEIINRGKGIFRTIQDWREQIRQSFLASTNGPGSAILQAMVLGEEGGLSDELRDRFMAAGVTHILSISGSHLGLVAILLFGLARGLLFFLPERLYNRLTLSFDPKKAAAWLIIPPVMFYAFLAGGQTATLRSLVMILFGLAALILDRENGLMHSLAAAALLILIVNPQALFEISFQLSYLSVLSIGYVVTFWNDLQISSSTILQKLRNAVVLLVMISIAASLVTGPLVALYFNQLSLAGVISNMLVVPFAGFVVVPLGLVSGMLSLLTSHLPLAGLNQGAADAFYGIVTFFSRLPGAEFHPPSPGIFSMVLYAVLLLSSAGYLRARLLSTARPLEYSMGIPIRYKIGAIAAGTGLIVIFVFSFLPRDDCRITFLDVGQGDCALVELPSGRSILIDGGGTFGNRFDTGRRIVAPYLRDRGIGTIDLVVLSHPHPDHMNGLISLAKMFPVAQVWTNGDNPKWPEHKEFLGVLRDRNIPASVVAADERITVLGEARLRVLHPGPASSFGDGKDYVNENNRSLVVRIEVLDRTLLFTGDIHGEAEQALVQKPQDLRCDVLKIPHHGSRTSSTEEFLSRAEPTIAVASVGRKNRYRHPSEDVVERYERNGTRLYRTDRDGAVIVLAGQDRIDVVPWAGLIVKRIKLDGTRPWSMTEGANWKRLWIRMISRDL